MFAACDDTTGEIPEANFDTLLRNVGNESIVANGSSSTAITAMAKAALTGDFEVFCSVLRLMEDAIDQDQVSIRR